ncbi:unnamed protein product [Durusdinium trenchii]|uniref:Uncharacterized protein n=2 Tax=Durusdinium trenchii TaxID=1381693 RepID=A0ABP0SK65_9DINO
MPPKRPPQSSGGPSVPLANSGSTRAVPRRADRAEGSRGAIRSQSVPRNSEIFDVKESFAADPKPPGRAKASAQLRSSGQGMAYARGAQAMREQQALRQKLQVGARDRSSLVLELVVRVACAAMQHAVREVCAVRTCSRQLCETCSEDAVWEQLYRLRWTPSSSVATGWRQAYLARLRRLQASFLARNLPNFVRKLRRRDGLPDLRKIHDALRMSFSLSLSHGPSASCQTIDFTEANVDASIQLFDTALCLRCTFSTLNLKCPLHYQLRGRSLACGKDEVLLTSSLQSPEDWSQSSIQEDCRFLRSPCGRVFAALWGDDSLAGIYVTLHYAQSLWPIIGASEAWALLARPPEPDDLDSALGLHDYTVLLTLRSAKQECFSNGFYKVHLFGLGSITSGFGGVLVDGRCCVEQSQAAAGYVEGKPSSRQKRRDKSYNAEVSHFEALAPHDSGVQLPFPCLRAPQITLQTAAFKSVLQDHCFMDVTVFDEHGHIFWAVSAVCQLFDACPHESSILQHRHVQVDFDRGSSASTSGRAASVRWLCLADRGAAQILVQLDFDCFSGGSDRQLPRVNAVTLHPEVDFLDQWWSSKYAQTAKGKPHFVPDPDR